MTDIASNEQFEEAETYDDEVQEDNVQIIDTIALDQRDEEDKGQQSVSITGSEAQDVDMTEEQSRVKVVLSVQDENSENPRVEIDLQVPEQISPLASLAALYTEDS